MSKKRYTLVWDNGDCVDGIEYDSLDAAIGDAEDTLINWEMEQRWDYPIDPAEWSEKQIDDWDYMIYNCSVYIIDNEVDGDDDCKEVWSPSYEDEKELGWVLYEEMKGEARCTK